MGETNSRSQTAFLPNILPNYLLIRFYFVFTAVLSFTVFFFGQEGANSIVQTDGGPSPDKPPGSATE